MISGFATPQGTARLRDRFASLREALFYRQAQHVPGLAELSLSSIGLGTYLGDPDESTDAAYTEAVATALRSGINVLDAAINYRHQRSERNIGAALRQMIAAGELKRDEVFVCTKAGYLSFDGNVPPDPRGYFVREYVETGVLDPQELVGGMHCISPSYLENQIERSRRNLGLETLDVFYLHNPESQLGAVSREVFRKRLKTAFGYLERMVKTGAIRCYGMATWNAFRLAPDAHDAVSLSDAEEIAQELAGDEHHFRVIQFPFNLGMLEACVLANQHVGKKNVSTLQAAHELGIAAVGSATLHQGHLTRGLPEFVSETLGLGTAAENAIQFSRSAPGMLTALVGMSRKEHVESNIKAGMVPPTAADVWQKLFQKAN